jgi:D-beta-D-heptose 7-phosphate kinase/D-beta-D-heptose 1-phosphate adenosyltransferase
MHTLIDTFQKRKIVVIGDIILDHYIWGDATRISPEAPVPVVHVHRDTHTAGGAANVALNLSRLGIRTGLCGWMGQDQAGFQLQDILQADKVAFNPALMHPKLPTIVKTRVIVQKQQLCRVDREAAPSVYEKQLSQLIPVILESLEGAHGVILSDYAKGVLQDGLINTVQAYCQERGILVAMDPKPRRRLQMQGMDLITPNRNEALELAEIECAPHDPFPYKAAIDRILAKYKPRHLVITLGAEGMLICDEQGHFEKIPTFAREVFDVSGAGDTVVATLTAALVSGATLKEATLLANTAAGIVVGKVGTVAITRDELISETNRS